MATDSRATTLGGAQTMLRQPRTRQGMQQMMLAELFSMQASMGHAALLVLPEMLLTTPRTKQTLLDDLQVRIALSPIAHYDNELVLMHKL